MQNNIKVPALLFYSYAHQDEPLRTQLETHLSLLRRQGLISEWHDRKIMAGAEWEKEINAHLEAASIILLLVSADFLASNYCYDSEMQRALDRHKQGNAHVIPIIVRPCEWQQTPFAHLQVLPRDSKPVTTWESQDMAWLSIVQGLRQVVTQLPSYKRPASCLSELARQNRLRLLKRIRQTWIEGVLEASLHQAALIELGLQEQPDALTNPWHLEVQETNRPPRPLPAGTSIAQMYDQADGELLLLGEPGAGKTTLLLQLARTLLERAETDENERLPVVFNLSCWTKKRSPLSDWLIEELRTKYQVPQKVGQDWITTNQILPLLDGLDEVAEEARSGCIQAINAYSQSRQDQGPVPLVVCCRSQEYLTLPTRVSLQRAVSIQPLTQKQIEDYFQRSQEQLQVLQNALHDDSEMYELARCPLMLSILTLAYQGATFKDLPTKAIHETHQRQVFATYIERMLHRRSVPKHFSREHIQRWLSFVAVQMQQQDQTIFYLEQLQPSWLVHSWARRVYEWGGIWLPNGLVGGLMSIAITTFIAFHSFPSLISLIQTFLLGGLLGGLLSRKNRAQQFATNRGKARGIPGSWPLKWLEVGGIIGTSFGLLGHDWSLGLSFGLCSVLLQGLLGKCPMEETISRTPPSAWRMTWQCLTRKTEIYNGILIGLLVGLSYGLNDWLMLMNLQSPGLVPYDWFTMARDVGIQYGLSYGLTGWLLSVLFMRSQWEIQLTDRLAWSLRSLGKSLTSKQHVKMTLQVATLILVLSSLGDGLTGMIEMGLAGGFLGWMVGLMGLLIMGGIEALIGGLSYWFLFGLNLGVSSDTIENQYRIVPNQGIYHSALNGLLFGLVSTLIVGLSSGLAIGLQYSWPNGVLSNVLEKALIVGLSTGSLMGLLNGGLACLQHYLLRLLLWRIGVMPWNLVCLLDEAVQLILLRKVGGGYIFIHRLLLDFLASLEKKDP